MRYMERSTNMGEMLVNGELDASVLYLTAPNLIDRSSIDLRARSDIRTLFADPKGEARRYYGKTGLFPINHTLVVRRSVLEQHPWVAQSLCDMFARAKEMQRVERDAQLESYVATGLLDAGAVANLARDPMPYGVVAARRELETIARYDFEQGLAKRVVGLDEIFAESMLGV
jgi:4,5-dihydroxyphthalate decarboxylase